jgi:hypothetical protein
LLKRVLERLWNGLWNYSLNGFQVSASHRVGEQRDVLQALGVAHPQEAHDEDAGVVEHVQECQRAAHT